MTLGPTVFECATVFEYIFEYIFEYVFECAIFTVSWLTPKRRHWRH